MKYTKTNLIPYSWKAITDSKYF